ncbi:MAG: DUF1439 domain-containing protein [Methylococcaceae bacterium]|nr:DUF1439 domain-containing protein [Methylococcaceae bacterium]
MALSYTVELSEAQLQKKVLAMMPIEKKKLFFTVILSDPEIELIEGSNEIGVFTHIEIDSKIGIKGTGRAKITGSLTYKPDSSEFFFKNTKIEKLEIDKVSQKYNQQIKALVQAIGTKVLSSYPVYKLKDDNLKHKLAKAVLQSISVKNKKLLLKLSVL